jgi:LysM repeat protein
VKPSRSQQAAAGLIVLLVVVATLAGGIVLGLADRTVPSAGQPPVVITARPTSTLPLPPTSIPGSPETPSASPKPPTPTVGVLPPTATPALPAASATPIKPTVCGPPSGWVTYQVQAGENLFRIGLRYGKSVAQMMSANCLSDERIYAGQRLYVPPVSPIPPTSPPPTSPPAAQPTSPPPTSPPAAQPTSPPPTVSASQCSDPNSVITSPRSGAALAGTIRLSGTANVRDFDHYVLDIRPDGSDTFYTFVTSRALVVNGLLGELNTGTYEPGQYWLRLLVYDTAGKFLEPCSVPVTITHEQDTSGDDPG